MRIALVIGHKITSTGACGNNLCEFGFNQQLVKDVARAIDPDIEVCVIYRRRYRDLPDQINEYNPDFIVSFHANAFNKKATGTETLYYHTSKKSKKLAKRFQRAMVDCLGLKDRGIKPKSSEERGGYLLRYTDAPCVIIEPFFIDNKKDVKTVLSRQPALVKSLSDVIETLIWDL